MLTAQLSCCMRSMFRIVTVFEADFPANLLLQTATLDTLDIQCDSELHSNTSGAVSYTHLDVYKRQAYKCRSYPGQVSDIKRLFLLS